MMEDEKQQQQHQKEEHQHHHQRDKHQQEHHKHPEEQKQQQYQEQQNHQEHQKLPEEEQKQQQQRNHQQEEKQQQTDQQELQKEEAAAENKQNHAVSQFPLSKRSKPPSDHSPVDSPLSSYHSPLSYGFSPLPLSQSSDPNSKTPSVGVSRAEFASRDQPTATNAEVEEQSHKPGSGSGKRLRPDLSIYRRTERDKMVRKALLGFRISGFVFCLVSFSILAADRDQGWALDSYYRYKEFRFCMAVNVIGFVYSGIQAYDLAYQLISRKQKPRSRFRCSLDFILDQMLAYVLISASSSAAVRVDDWQSNWGKDKFPDMARASMALSMLAFVALALSSLISGYTLSTF